MVQGSLLVSLAALIVSALSYYFAVMSWRESYRPIVTARVRTHSSGNIGAALELIVENSGSRPARDILLKVDDRRLAEALTPSITDFYREEIRACFSAKFAIPVLANGASVSNAFGFYSRDEQNTWCWHSRVPVQIDYQDLEGRKFRHKLDLFIANNEGFASSAWHEKK